MSKFDEMIDEINNQAEATAKAAEAGAEAVTTAAGGGPGAFDYADAFRAKYGDRKK
jgi:hypothetical protein